MFASLAKMRRSRHSASCLAKMAMRRRKLSGRYEPWSGSCTASAPGLDLGLISRAGVRILYWDDLYKAPDVVETYGASDTSTQTGEATVGVYFPL